MYLIDHVAELRFVNRLIYAIKRIYTHTHTKYEINKSPKCTICKNIVQNRVGSWGSAPDPAGAAYDAPPDPLVVMGFLPSAIAASRLRRLNPISPPKQKLPVQLAPKHKILEP